MKTRSFSTVLLLFVIALALLKMADVPVVLWAFLLFTTGFALGISISSLIFGDD